MQTRNNHFRPGRLYLFPAFLPLIEIVPWLLALAGTAAGIAGMSMKEILSGHQGKVMIAAVLCFFAAGGVVVSALPDRVVREDGSEAVKASELPVPVVLSGTATQALAPREYRSFAEIWTRHVPKQILSTPVILNGVLAFGSYEGSVEAMSAETGEDLWSLPQKAPVFTLSTGNGVIYSGEGLHHTQQAHFTAINPVDGKPLWQRRLLGHIEEIAAIDDDNGWLWTGSGPGGLWALDKDDGSVRAHYPLGHIDARPLLHGGVVFVPAQQDETKAESILSAVDIGSGKLHWQIPVKGMPWASPQVNAKGNIILSTSGMGQIGVNKPTDRGWAQGYAVEDGHTIWQIDLPGMPLQPSYYIAPQDIVVHSLKTGEIAAYRATDGTEVWRVRVGGELQAPATLIEGFSEPLLAASSYDGSFVVIRARDGAELARRSIRKGATSSPVASGDVVFVTTSHDVVAFGGLHFLAEMK